MENTQPNFERVDKIITDLGNLLEAAKAPTVEKFKKYAAVEAAPDEIYRTLEVFSTQDYSLALNRFYAREEEGVLKLKTDWAVENDQTSLASLKEYTDALFDGSVEYTQEEENAFAEQSDNQLYAWLFECWKEAGGAESKLPFYFALNKEYKCHDPFTGEVLSEEDTAKKLGHNATV